MDVCVSQDLLWRPSSAKAEIRRYALAAAAVLTLGGGAALAVAERPSGQVSALDAEDAVLLDLPALPSSAPPTEAAEGPEQQAMDAAAEPKPVESPPDNPPDPPPPPEPQPAAPIEAQKPTAPETPPVAAAAAQEAMAPAGSQAPVAAAEPIESEAAARPAGHAISLWQRAMLTRLEHAKSGTRPGGLSGTVHIAFTIDRAGRLLSSRIVHGSGSVRLDQIALTLLGRAAPFPAPPSGVADAALTFTVPIFFANAR
ncbi:energy transducer TonB [Beijerinckia sp. L45]|uniref:energy transducer TonB family protein n=1 Tax=Beijerinckia sp. L45 TaxID=1641855 RepID=UPI00131A951D|nr:energy transducer TonB [Beijerinckia sp. L45]